MKKIFTLLMVFILGFSGTSGAIETKKGETFNENIVFRQTITSRDSDIPSESNILLDFSEKVGLVYKAPQNRAQASNRGTELSDVDDFYNGWFWDYCGEQIEITDYDGVADGDGAVIGHFTLASAFAVEPPSNATIKLIDPDGVDAEFDQIFARVSTDGQIQIGDDLEVAVVHDNSGGFIKYNISDEVNQAFPLVAKPVKTTSVSAATFCVVFGSFAAFQDPYIEKFGIFLDSVPADTKARIYLLGSDELNHRYPIMENVGLDEFARGLGDDVSVSTYADESTWNLISMANPAITKLTEQFLLVYSFSDDTGAPRFLDVPIDASFTDASFFRTMRSDQIQAASGTSITLDTDASPRDDDYNGMRLYFGSEFRDIIDYDGTTKVATVDSTYTTTPSANDDYDIKIAFLSPLSIFEYRDVAKGKIQDKHNVRCLAVEDSGSTLEIGTRNYVDASDGDTTFTTLRQSGMYEGGFMTFIDSDNSFDVNPVKFDFHPNDRFQGASGIDYTMDEAGTDYEFYFKNPSFGWDVDINRHTFHDRQIVNDNTLRTTSSASYVDIPGASITAKDLYADGTYQVMFDAAAKFADDEDVATFKLVVDGVDIIEKEVTIKESDGNVYMIINTCVDDVQVGDIIKMQWKIDGSSIDILNYDFYIDGIPETRLVN